VDITPPVPESCFQDFPKGPLFPIENTLVRPPHRAHTRQSGTETEPLNESGGNGDFNRWQSSRPVQPPARLKKLCVFVACTIQPIRKRKAAFQFSECSTRYQVNRGASNGLQHLNAAVESVIGWPSGSGGAMGRRIRVPERNPRTEVDKF